MKCQNQIQESLDLSPIHTLPLHHCSIHHMQNAIANMIYAQADEIKKLVSLTDDPSCIADINGLINKNIYLLTIFESGMSNNLNCCCSNMEPCRPVCDVDGGTF